LLGVDGLGVAGLVFRPPAGALLALALPGTRTVTLALAIALAVTPEFFGIVFR
jgi:hypothetical protein